MLTVMPSAGGFIDELTESVPIPCPGYHNWRPHHATLHQLDTTSSPLVINDDLGNRCTHEHTPTPGFDGLDERQWHFLTPARRVGPTDLREPHTDLRGNVFSWVKLMQAL
jgi:hypothetical protein